VWRGGRSTACRPSCLEKSARGDTCPRKPARRPPDGRRRLKRLAGRR
jgi:hypothetical protein